MTNEESIQLDILSAYIGSPLTDEQKEFASDFTKDIVSFSDPGTGKTHTVVAGLVMAQTVHKVQGKQINCMSFTRDAVSEVSGRYKNLCARRGVPAQVVFNTFHSLSNKILRSAYPTMKITAYGNVKQDVEDMTAYLKQLGFNEEYLDKKHVRKVIRAINNLNSSLTFHPSNIMRKYDFIELNMELEAFQSIRKLWFLRGVTTGVITQGDIPLYCLYALMRDPKMVAEWHGKYKIMVVDEFQDLSLLHLRILSYIAETLIVIGDMKQQIYAFNGACPQIVQEYLKLRPNASICNLTKSFRCGQEIADFATRIIKPNDENVECFTGHNRGSSVSIVHRRDLNWKDIIKDIEADRKVHGANKARDVMFLYRNNASAIPIVEELYKYGIPYRCSKYTPIMEIPIFESLTKLCNAAWMPNDAKAVSEALRLFPEFKDVMPGTDPTPVQAMKSSKKNIFEVSYRYKENSSYKLLNAMQAAGKAIADNKSAGVVYMKVLDVYNTYIYKNEWWKIDRDAEFYLNLASPICNSKPYPLMYNEELDKVQRNDQCIQAGMGVRCYTMHSAKGLEADDVYILDCDEGIFPNSKVLSKKESAGCYLDVATDIRSERNLLYVAITRAKDNVIISYSGTEPARLLTDPECAEYSQYDNLYKKSDNDYDDAAEFYKLFNLGDDNG